MTLRATLDDFKRNRGARTAFPGERRTTAGLFAGSDRRLVHVGRDGALRDFSYPLSGLYGIDRSRLGVCVDGETVWLDALEPTDQRYVDDTTLVRTTYETDAFALDRLDLAVDGEHVTHVAVESGPVEALVAFLAFAPDGREDRVGQLVHDEDVVEVYHRTERDYVASATGFEAVAGQLPEGLADVLAEEPTDHPTGEEASQYEDGRLGGYVVTRLPVEDGSAALLTSVRESPGAAAVADVAETAAGFADADALVEAASGRPAADRESVVADLRVVDLLSAPSGSRIAGPDFDPHYLYSGGYGYTWFRDDAEIARFLLESEATLDLDLGATHDASAAVYEATQLDDGTWPHRVWPVDGSLAPGWANDRVRGEGVDYQADQTASVLSFLAAYAETADERRDAVEPVVERGLDGLDATLADDGLPEPCQNAWENMAGRFTHTAATYLHAYAAVAAAPFDADRRDRAAERAREVYRALDDLWVDDRGVYALRARDGDLDDRLDSSTFALVDAHRAYGAIGEVDDERLDRLRSHVDATLAGLWRETDAVRGLVRFEGDDWRTRTQDDEKVWTVSTAWGANAAAAFAALADDDGYYRRSRELLAELLPGGSLCLASGYLPEQVFDDGTPDSATPLGWPHALRLATVAELDAADELTPVAERVDAGAVGN
ncbi:glycoside hydrolase family 15 protein [Salinilacihabitans rarus]|uniref:glycoside hydrolase family 15 protein n=1 Tax=Salinilacihabitans rarus TaxID=2961596 RepID=UPI0020C8DA16|nr:glycoside hydrolase family 15 protein [Salinilacihabitans rarus]